MKLEEANLKLTIPASLCFDLSSTKVDVISKLPFQYEANPVLLDMYSVQNQMLDYEREHEKEQERTPIKV